jgi:GTP-binding protein
MEHVPSDRGSKTRSRYASKDKKNKNAKGRAFRDVVGYGGMIPALEAGLKPARAMRKAKKLEPKPFSGKVAMYYANTSDTPYQEVTEATMPNLPKPNEIRTVQSLRASSDVIGSESTEKMVDFVVGRQEGVTPRQLKHQFETAITKGQFAEPHPSTPFTTPAAPSDDATEEYEDFDADQDIEEYAPRHIAPDDDSDLVGLSPTTRDAVTKVRHLFRGTLSFYQPLPGEISEFMAQKAEKLAQIPSQRTALTSATATSVRSILNGKKDGVAPSTDMGVKLKPIRGIQAKSFFDAGKILDLASSEFVKAKRSGKEPTTPLKQLMALPQICVVGRSNVGKSSLLSAIMGPNFKKLRVSKTPGRTQDLHMVVVSEKLAVVDMPGYGYAAASPAARKEMEARIGEYLSSKLPSRVFLLIDARRGLGNSDIRLADSLEKLHLVYQIVLTKCDKISNHEKRALTHKNITDWLRRRPCGMPEVLETSSKDRTGLDQLRVAIYLACGIKL